MLVVPKSAKVFSLLNRDVRFHIGSPSVNMFSPTCADGGLHNKIKSDGKVLADEGSGSSR